MNLNRGVQTMRKFFRHYFLLVCAGLAPVVAIAAPDLVPTIQAVEENPGTFIYVFAVAMIALIALAIRMIHLSDKNSTAHWRETRSLRGDLTTAEKDILVLKTEHKHNHRGPRP